MQKATRATHKGYRGHGPARLRPAALVGLLLSGVLAGCSDRVLDTGLTLDTVIGDLPPEAPPGAPIRRITGADTSWPNLATVPPRPRDVPTAGSRQEDMTRLAGDRETGFIAGEGLRDLNPPLSPLPVPPPVDLGPPGRRKAGGKAAGARTPGGAEPAPAALEPPEPLPEPVAPSAEAPPSPEVPSPDGEAPAGR